ncbi:MAG: Ca-activated chloride channel family protein [Arcticibacterium sp.]|jgi:Ca-activated chloride channel family protein
MNWSRGISYWEFIYILTFLSFYGYYFFKTKNIGKYLGRASKAIYIKFLLRTIVVGLMIAALLGPNFGLTETDARKKGKDVILAIDLSASMNSTDISPSRLDRVKIEVNNLINQMEANRVGLLVFSTQAYWQVPLTFDLSLVKETLSSLNTEMMPKKGSNLNAVLTAINSKFVQNAGNDRSQAALVFTDGENFAELNTQLKATLDTTKSSLYIIGVGTEDGADVLSQGLPLVQEDGSIATTKLDAKALRKLSIDLGSRLFILNKNQSNLAVLVPALNAQNEVLVTQTKLLVGNNKYANFLLVALILIALDIMFSIKVFKV